jgi:archaellin
MEKTRDTMNDKGNLGVTTGILLICLVLIGVVSASVIINETTSVSDTDLTQITNEVVDEISSYLQIKTIVGKYQTIQGEQKIQKIAILIKPLISLNIDITHMIIKISNGEQLYLLYFNGNTSPIGSYSLFDHPLWGTLTETTFTLIPLIDDDNSMTIYHFINKNTDNAFLLIKLPDDCTMKKGDIVQVTLLPSPGVERTVLLEAPLPTSHIVTLYG